jgi:hypothetical protein
MYIAYASSGEMQNKANFLGGDWTHFGCGGVVGKADVGFRMSDFGFVASIGHTFALAGLSEKEKSSSPSP